MKKIRTGNRHAWIRRLTVLALLCLPVTTLPAENRLPGVRFIITEIRVSSWDAAKRIWYEGAPIKRITETFDPQGRIVRRQLADGKNVLLETTNTVYGKGVITSYAYGPDKKLRRTATIKRNGAAEGLTVRLSDGAVLYRERRTYDAKGRLRESTRTNQDGAAVFTNVYQYDEQENLSVIRVRNPEGTLAVEISYEYITTEKQGPWVARREYYSYADVFHRPHETQTRRFVFRKQR